jgi:hypothetical protein
VIRNRFLIDPDAEALISESIKRLKRGLFIVFALAVLSGGYVAWWYVVASQLETNIVTWIEQQRSQGVEATFEKIAQKGFLGSVHFSIKKPKIQKSGPRGWTWSGDVLNLSLKPWAIHRLMFNVAGSHQWKLHNPASVTIFEGTTKKWSGVFTLKEGAPDQVNINLNALEIKDVSANNNFQVTEADISISEISEQAPSFKFRILGIELPEMLQSPLGRDVHHVNAKGHFTGRFKLGKWPDVLAAWRDGGGALDFKSLDLDYPPLRVWGDGTITLDSHMQPVGAFAVKAGGVFETVDALYDQGMIPMGTLFATKIALGLLSEKTINGDSSYLNMALTLQDQTLYNGTVKLLKISPVRW